MKKILATMLLAAMLITLIPAQSVQAATYRNGSKGTKVEYLQRNLTFLGFSTKGTDGDFGNNTRKAVLDVQKALGFAQTGIVDEELYTLIVETVSGIQTHLKNKGYYIGKIDGVAGNGTQTAFKRIQKELGYAQTGTAERYVLTEMISDVEASMETKSLREWVARINGIYSVALESEYYEKYGEDYLKLFMEYPELLTSDEIFAFLDYVSSSAKILQEEAKEEYIEASVWEGFANGASVVVKDILSKFGIGKNLVEQTTYDSIMTLISKMYYKDDKLFGTIKDTEEAIKQFGDIYSFSEKSSQSLLVVEIVKANPNLALDEVEKVLDIVGENWSNISNGLEEGITATEYIVAMLQLYAMTGAFMEDLQEVVKQPSVLYADIEYLKQERERDMEEFLINELAAYGVVELVEEVLSLATNEMYGMVTDGIDFLSKFAVTASAYEQVYALLFEAYCENLADTISIMRKDFTDNGKFYIKSEWAEKISNYETAYIFYLCAVETYYESVAEMVNTVEKKAIEQDLKFLQTYSYDMYIEYCIAKMRNIQNGTSSGDSIEGKAETIVERMDQLLDMVGNTYFTTTQSACLSERESGHWCDKCSISNIVKQQWFKNKFGNVNVDTFPEHDVTATRRDHSGQSCFGFACFAQWYLYKADNSSAVTASRVAEGPFNKEFMKNNVQPGDVLRLVNSDTDAHSVVVYSVEDTGIYVIDSNWSNKLNCYVQKHWISYNDYYARAKVYVNRVTDVVIGSTDTNGGSDSKTQYGYYHYTNGAGEYAVCGYYGVSKNGWTNVYREEIWIDEPLTKIASEYRHVHQSGCDEIGCWNSDFWINGDKYIDNEGVVWYRQQKKTVPKDTNGTQSYSVIIENYANND